MKIKRNQLVIVVLILFLILVGHLLYAQFADYTYRSDENFRDIFLAKAWTLAWISTCALVFYLNRSAKWAPQFLIWALSAYFVIAYGLLFRGAEFGLNGLWGDNFYRLSMVNKSYHFGGIPDAHQKGLSSLYPPLWFWTMARYAKIIGIQPYQTVKYGYLFIFLVYPWLLYFSWKKLTTDLVAALVTVATIFLGYRYLDYLYYEHISAALFLPWWLYYLEFEAADTEVKYGILRRAVAGSVIGGLIFLTYYWWFFLLVVAIPISTWLRYRASSDWKEALVYVRRSFLILAGVALVSAIYWVPLVISALKTGMHSTQATWFNTAHANITGHWPEFSISGVLTMLGIASAFYLWRKKGSSRIGILFLSGFALIVLDRFLNISHMSIQTRKALEFAHVFALAPLTIACIDLWERKISSMQLKRFVVALILLVVLVFSNEHTQIFENNLYASGINQRVPQTHLDLLNTVNPDGKVFITNWYVEACIIPFYAFIPTSKVHTHFAGEFDARLEFLKSVGSLRDPEVVSYALTNNRFDTVNCIFLPYNGDKDAFVFQLTSVPFNVTTVFDTLYIAAGPYRDTSYFSRPHWKGPIEVKQVQYSPDILARVEHEHPELMEFLESSRQ